MLLFEEALVVAQIVAEEGERLDRRSAAGGDLDATAARDGVGRGELLVQAHRIVGADDGDTAAERDLRGRGGGGVDQRAAMELRCGLEWEKSRLSHQLRRMQQRGLVDRAGCDDDGRASMVQITAVGRDVLGRAREVNDALVQRYVVETLGASRLDALGEIAGLVLAALDDETGPTHH